MLREPATVHLSNNTLTYVRTLANRETGGDLDAMLRRLVLEAIGERAGDTVTRAARTGDLVHLADEIQRVVFTHPPTAPANAAFPFLAAPEDCG